MKAKGLLLEDPDAYLDTIKYVVERGAEVCDDAPTFYFVKANLYLSKTNLEQITIDPFVWEYTLRIPIDADILFYISIQQPDINCSDLKIQIYFNDVLIDEAITNSPSDVKSLGYMSSQMREL